MFKDSLQYLVAAVISAALVVTAGIMLDDSAGRTNPDRDDTRLERVIDVELPTL